MAVFVAANVVNVPMYDEWILSPLVLAFHAGTLHAADLWTPQGAHRSVVPTAIILGLSALDSWNVRIEALAGVAFTALGQLALWQLVRAGRPFLIASLVLYAITQSENWLWGFQLSWFLVNACALGAVALLAGENRRALRVTAAIAAALIASFSLIFGFAVWVAGAVVIVARRDRRAGIAWACAAILASAAFLWNYRTPHFENGWLGNAPSPLLDGLQFALAYLGGPLGIAGGRWLCEALGAALMVAFAFTFAGAERRAAAPWLALLAFALCAAVFEAIGRAGNGVDAALAFRYTTPSSLGWVALIGLWSTNPPRVRIAARRAIVSVAAVLFAVANVAGAYEALQLVGAQRAAFEVLRDPAAHDDEELALYINDPAMLRTAAAQLEAAHLGPYRDPTFKRPAP
ncbi:MAG TPA: hypothetical protein VGP41_03415 [Candidatus Lustribacter sp.]|jgi:hypothetical protein|nr:hypothetical protein [Candidatus Lustribacter sp.]